VRASRVAAIVAWVVWIGYAIYYVASARPPHGIAGDLGYSVVGIGRIAALATSWRDVADMIGWGTWCNCSTFLYAPMGQYVLGVPVDLLLRDPVRTVKLAQVVQFTLAFLGAARLYSAVFGRSPWRWFAAFVYAAIPLSSTLLQWDGDFGWVVAFAPWVPVVALVLGRRFGAAALPLAGILCGLATFAFSPEQGVMLGLPLLVLTLAIFRRERIALPPLWIASAFAALLLLPAYVALPTRYGAHPMWWTSGTLSEFDRDASGLRSIYGQGPIAAISGVYNERVIASTPIYNWTSPLLFAFFAGAAALGLAIYAFVSTGLRPALRRWWPAVAIGAICAALAGGTRMPFLGPLLWNGVLPHVPLLNALRTPDRFAQIGTLLIALAAAYGAQAGFARGGAARKRVTAAALVVAVGYVIFGIREGVLGFDAIGRLPDFAAINASVESAGGRTAVFAFPQGGSPLDFAAYAPNAPTVEYAWTLMQRHVDGDGGVALLRRGAVRSIVTTPNWTQPTIEGMPGDMAEPVERSASARPSLLAPSGAPVVAVHEPRAKATNATPVCALGGPDGFEHAAGEPFLDSAALVHDVRAGCARTVLAEADPLDVAIPAQAVSTWVGAALFGDLGFPTPNKFEVDRMQLAVPWYRDAYDGDSVLAGNPLITAASGASNAFSFAIAKPGRYSVYVRASGPAAFQIRLPGRIVNGSSVRMQGFGWVELPLGNLPAGPQTLSLAILRFVELEQRVVVDEVAVAPSSLALPHLSVDAAIVTRREFVPPRGIDARAPQYLFPRLAGGGWGPGASGVQIDAGTQIGVFNGEPEIRTSEPNSRIRFTWPGDDGDYEVATVAWLAGTGSHEIVSAGGRSFDSRYDASIAPKPFYGQLLLRHGAPIDVTLTSRGTGSPALVELVALRVRAGDEPPTEYDDLSESWRFDAAESLPILTAMRSSHVAMTDGAIRALAGTSVVIPFHPDLVDGQVTVDLVFAGGSGRVTLRCGASSDTVDAGAGTLNPTGADLLVKRSTDSPCSVRVTWLSDGFALKSVHVRATGSTSIGWSATQYFSDGTYRWESEASPATLAIDGTPWDTGAVRHLSTGFHRLTLLRAPVPLPALRFFRDAAWPLPAASATGVVQISSTSWTAHTTAPATFEIAELNDGHWFARGSRATVAGYECDLVNTCFDVGGSQDVSIGRTLPPTIAWGMAITFGDILAAALLLAAGLRQGRSRRTG
jgi:hypothetical protein